MRILLTPVVLLLAGALVPAQVAIDRFGYLVTGQNGTAGEFCWIFDCTPRPLAVVAGETLTLRVNAPHLAFFAIGASLGPGPCVPVPGIANALLLDPGAIVVLASALVGQPSPVLACWGGVEQVPLALPPGLPLGVSFHSQAIAELTPAWGLAFSVAVAVTVQ